MGMSEFYGPTDEKSAVKVIHEAFDGGITFFDTADMYGRGENEKLLGKAIKSFRDEIIVATKCGFERIGEDLKVNNSRDYIKKACDGSLKRLGIDTIDVYFLHRHDPKIPIEESMKVMLELFKQGKIQYVGLSEVSPETLKRADAVLGDRLTAVQSEYSLINHETAEKVLPTCRNLDLGFVPFSPLARGLLSGRIKDSKAFNESNTFDFRSIAPQFGKEALQNNLLLVEALEKLAKQKNCTVGQLALAWLLAQGDDIVPIPGTKKSQYLKENIAAVDIHLSENDLAAIRKLMKQYPIRGTRLPEQMMHFNYH